MATAELPQAEDPVERERREIKGRMLRALWIPIVAVLGVVFYVLNFSRVLIAGKGNPAIIVATIATITILVGATVLSAAPRMRTSSLVMLVAGALGLLLAAGSVVVGHADEKHAASGPVGPTGPAVGTLDVTAEASLTFDKKQYTAPAGVVQVNYIDGGGTHTLVFDDPALKYFELAVPGGPKTAKVELAAGKTYTIYCTIPGHRSQGMEATLTVGAAAPAAPPGAPAPATPTTAAPKAGA
jgi:plastocyanin